MKDRSVAVRYARALEGALDGDAELETVAAELATVASILSSDPTAAAALTSPVYAPAQKQALIETLRRAVRLSQKSERFLKLLSERGHMGALVDAAAALGEIRDRRLGIVEAEVTTAAPIDSELTRRAQHLLEKTTGRQVRLSLKTDPALVGGVIARVGSVVYDGSIRTRLEGMRSRIAQQ